MRAMVKKTLRNPAFCILPFIERFQNLNGKRYLCCNSNVPVDDPEMDDIRYKLLSQQKIPHCETCYQQEQKKIISPRQLQTSRWLRDPEVKEYIEGWKAGESRTYFYDIRFDSKCNLACICCNPTNSSLWAKELGIENATNELCFDIKEALSSKKVYLAGGEPLIIDQFIDFINDVANLDQQPELVINTNLTRVNEKLKATMVKIKKLTLVVSIDAYGSINEYHRWPMKWDKLIKNLEWARSIKCNIRFNTVVDAISIMNVHQLREIEHFADEWNLVILTEPAALVINNVPSGLKDQVSNRFNDIKRSDFYKKDPIFKRRVDAISDMIMMDGNEKMLREYIDVLDKRRNINHEDYLGFRL